MRGLQSTQGCKVAVGSAALDRSGGVMIDDILVPFATVEELKARCPDMPAGAEEHAEVLLEDASQFILDVCPSAADVSAGTRRRIVCSVVRRSIEAQSSDRKSVV